MHFEKVNFHLDQLLHILNYFCFIFFCSNREPPETQILNPYLYAIWDHDFVENSKFSVENSQMTERRNKYRLETVLLDKPNLAGMNSELAVATQKLGSPISWK